jgi:hypothetical protein
VGEHLPSKHEALSSNPINTKKKKKKKSFREEARVLIGVWLRLVTRHWEHSSGVEHLPGVPEAPASVPALQNKKALCPVPPFIVAFSLRRAALSWMFGFVKLLALARPAFSPVR